MAAAAGAAARAAAAQPAVVVQQPAPSTSSDSGDGEVQKMQQLQDLYDKGLISEDEYNQKKQQVLNAS